DRHQIDRRILAGMRTRNLLLVLLIGSGSRDLRGQAALRGLVDVHVHYNGDKAFLRQMAARLDKYDGTAFILMASKDLPDVQAAMKEYPKRFVGLGSIRLDDAQAVAQVDRFHEAGFRGLG